MIGLFQPRQPIPDAVAEYAPYADIAPIEDYLMWACLSERLELDDSSIGLGNLPEAIADWHPSLRRLVEGADPRTVLPVGIRVAAPVPAWRSSRITYLGDAIHTMSPAGGTGANTALLDAADLTATLAGATDPCAAIAEYDRRLRERGEGAIEQSLRYGEQFAAAIHKSGKDTADA